MNKKIVADSIDSKTYDEIVSFFKNDPIGKYTHFPKQTSDQKEFKTSQEIIQKEINKCRRCRSMFEEDVNKYLTYIEEKMNDI